MGGIGSGRQRQNPPIADFLQFDVRQMQRQSALESGAVRSCQWTKDGAVLARAFLSIGTSELTIRYRLLVARDTVVEATYEIGIVQTACHFGGSRPWFLCPECGRRVAILYGDARLACRHCRRPTYPIQRIAPMGCSLARAQRLRVELGGSVDLTLPFPAKPKGMHTFTYTKLAIRAMVAETQFNADVGRWIDTIRGKAGNNH